MTRAPGRRAGDATSPRPSLSRHVDLAGPVLCGEPHEQQLAAIGALTGGIAHDFNNILSVILGYGERAMSNSRPGSRLRCDLENIVAAGRRGRSLVDQVLTLGRGEVVEPDIVDVEVLVREVLDLLVPHLPRSIAVKASLTSGCAPVQVRAVDLHRLVMNLATNAINAMPKGGTLRASVATERVGTARATTVGSVTAGDYVVLQVADSGIGIAPESVHRIFDRFYSTRSGDGGTGLGLSVVRDVALAAGGAIEVDSCLEGGSRFIVFLPRAHELRRGRIAVRCDEPERRS